MTREQAIEFARISLELYADSQDTDTYAFYQMAIQSLEERKQGEWITHKDEHQCTNCKEIIIVSPDYWNDNEYDFCPNCGADMRLKDNV